MKKLEKNEQLEQLNQLEQLEQLKQDYHTIKAPDALEDKIKESFKKQHHKVIWMRTFTSVAAAFLLFVAGLNMSSSFAMALSEVPVIGEFVKVLTFRFEKIENDNVMASVETPVISGLSDKELEATLNEKYYEENKALYETFKKEIPEIEAMDGHMGIVSGYEILTDTDEILSIGRYNVNIVGSSSTTMKYDTIDKVNSVMVTLPSLFKDEHYIERISEYIIETMIAEMEADDSKIYWVLEEDIEPFKAIHPDQNFYITAEGKLVIAFDKYEVAPGYMGLVTFEIPTEIIQDLLVNDYYVK